MCSVNLPKQPLDCFRQFPASHEWWQGDARKCRFDGSERHALEHQACLTEIEQAVESAGEGRVLVVDGGASLRRALVGGNLAAAAARNGWAGIVIDGCVRDVAELAACAVGIRALACMPLPTEKRGAGERDVPVQIQGVWVRPGDRLVADADGIVVMPAG